MDWQTTKWQSLIKEYLVAIESYVRKSSRQEISEEIENAYYSYFDNHPYLLPEGSGDSMSSLYSEMLFKRYIYAVKLIGSTKTWGYSNISIDKETQDIYEEVLKMPIYGY